MGPGAAGAASAAVAATAGMAHVWYIVLILALIGFGSMIIVAGIVGFFDILDLFRFLDEEHAKSGSED